MPFLTPQLQGLWIRVLKARLRIPVYLRKIYFNLVVFLSLILFVTGTSIIIYTYNEFIQDVSLIVEEKIDSIAEITAHRMNNFLKPTEEVAETCSFIFQNLNTQTVTQTSYTLLGYLKSFPQIDTISIIEESGHATLFSRIQQNPLQSSASASPSFFKKETITLSEDGTQERKILFLNQKNQLVPHTPSEDTSTTTNGASAVSDPRHLAWYRHVKKTMQPYLTSLSLLYNHGVGLTVAYPIYRAETNEFIGAVGVDVNIYELSKLVKIQSIGSLGLACLISQTGDILSHPDMTKIFHLTTKGMKFQKIQNLKEYNLPEAFQAFQQGHHKHLTKKRSNFFYDVVRFSPLKQWMKRDSLWSQYVLVMAFLGDRLSSHIEQARRDMLIFSGVMLLFAALFMFMLAQRVTQPIVKIVSYLKKIQNMDFDIKFDSTSYFWEISQTVEVLKGVVSSLQSFSKFVPKALVRQLFYAKKDAVLGGERKLLTVLFSDIQDFTTISEKMDGEALMLHLSDYFEALTHIIHDHKGTLDKYIGDAIMSFWGAPVSDDQQAVHACQTALESQKKLKTLNQTWENQGKPALVSRFGITTGEVIVGNIGSFDRFQYTVLGDDVNLAARLEGSNKFYGTSILVSEACYQRVKKRFILRPVDLVAVKGKETGVRIYELLAEMGTLRVEEESRLVELAMRTEEALHFYLDRQWETAIRRYKYILRDFGEDSLSQFFIERCLHFIKNPPPTDWDGVQRMTFK